MSDFTDNSFEESDGVSIDEPDLLESNSEFSPIKRNADLDDSTLEKASRFLFAEDLVAYVSHEFYSISYEVKIKEGREMLHDAFNEIVQFAVDLIRWEIQEVHCPLLKSFGELCKCNKLYYQRFVKGILKHYSCENANPGTFLYLCVYFTELTTGCYSPHFPEVLDCAVYAIIDAITVLNKEWKELDAVAKALILPSIEDYSSSVYKPSPKLIQQDAVVEHPDVEESALKGNINDSKTLKTLCSELEETLTITYCINECDAMKQTLSGTEERTEAVKHCVEMKKMDASNVTNEVVCNSLLRKKESEEKIAKLDLPVNGVKASYEADECEDLNAVSTNEKNVERLRNIPFDLEKLKLLTEENKCASISCISMSTKKEILQTVKKIIAELEKYVDFNEIDEPVDVRLDKKTKRATHAIQKSCTEMGELEVNEFSKSEEIICSLPLPKNGNDGISFTSVDNGNENVSQLKNSGGTDSSKHFCPQSYKFSDSLPKVNEDLLNEVICIVRSEVCMFLSKFLSSYSYTTLDSCAGSKSDNDECTKLNENLKLLEIKSSDSEVLKDQLEHSSPTFTGESEATLTQPVDVQRQENEEIVDSVYGILTDSNSHEKIGNEL